MNLLNLLRADSSVVSVVGSGGKSTLILALAQELAAASNPPADKPIILATTTHMLAPQGIPYVENPSSEELPVQLAQARATGANIVCVGRTTQELTPQGIPKICCPDLPLATLAAHARLLLLEADGSKRLPLKLHAAHEPVLPKESDTTLLVLGASGFMRPAAEVLHRAESLGAAFGITEATCMTPELVARLLATEIKSKKLAPQILIVNQVETPEAWQQARAFIGALGKLGVELPSYAGSVRNHELELL